MTLLWCARVSPDWLPVFGGTRVSRSSPEGDGNVGVTPTYRLPLIADVRVFSPASDGVSVVGSMSSSVCQLSSFWRHPDSTQSVHDAYGLLPCISHRRDAGHAFASLIVSQGLQPVCKSSTRHKNVNQLHHLWSELSVGEGPLLQSLKVTEDK